MDSSKDTRASLVPTWSLLGVLGASIAASGCACCVMLIVAMALLEIPFSLTFAVIMGVILLFLGALVLVRVVRDRSKITLTSKTATCSAVCLVCTEYSLLVLVALLALCGGVFAMCIYFQARTLPPHWRSFMYCILGASTTTLVSQNVLGIVEDIYYYVATPKTVARKSGLEISVRVKEMRLFPWASQNFVLYFTSLATGLYYGYMYGQIAAREMSSADPRSRYNPWTPVYTYIEFSLPVAAVAGFLSVLLAASIPSFVKSITVDSKKEKASREVRTPLLHSPTPTSSSTSAVQNPQAQTTVQRRQDGPPV